MARWPPISTEMIKIFIYTQFIICYSWAENSTVSTVSSRSHTNTTHKIPDPSHIIGGVEAKDGEFPYIVALMPINDIDEQTGAGTIIKSNWVLTARHNLISEKSENEPKELLITEPVVTPKYSNKLSKMKGKKKYKVEKMFCYHEVDDLSDQYRADVGLLKLSEHIPLGNDSEYGFQNVPMLKTKNDVDWTKEVRIIGWGQTRHTATPNAEDYPDHLMVVSTKVNSDEECQKLFDVYKSPNVLCIGQRGQTAGSADSGGPAIGKGVEKNEIQIGIVSFGKSHTYSPTVFSNVSYFLPWIKDRMQDEDPKDECKNVYSKRLVKNR